MCPAQKFHYAKNFCMQVFQYVQGSELDSCDRDSIKHEDYCGAHKYALREPECPKIFVRATI